LLPATSGPAGASLRSPSMEATRTHESDPERYSARRTSLEPLLSVAEVAELLGVSGRQVYNLLARGELPAVRVGARIRFRPEDSRRQLESARI
jgi:excisionase family DNA binding protein